MFKRLLRDKRAITPVLSSLLLTVVAVAAMAIATSATYMITSNLKDNMSERVVIEDIWFTGGAIKVHLFNVGKVSISISNVYVNHERIEPNPPFRLGLNQDKDLVIYYGDGVANVTYIDIVTSRGTHIASYYETR